MLCFVWRADYSCSDFEQWQKERTNKHSGCTGCLVCARVLIIVAIFPPSEINRYFWVGTWQSTPILLLSAILDFSVFWFSLRNGHLRHFLFLDDKLLISDIISSHLSISMPFPGISLFKFNFVFISRAYGRETYSCHFSLSGVFDSAVGNWFFPGVYERQRKVTSSQPAVCSFSSGWVFLFPASLFEMKIGWFRGHSGS